MVGLWEAFKTMHPMDVASVLEIAMVWTEHYKRVRKLEAADIENDWIGKKFESYQGRKS
jgi:hypothetical protein